MRGRSCHCHFGHSFFDRQWVHLLLLGQWRKAERHKLHALRIPKAAIADTNSDTLPMIDSPSLVSSESFNKLSERVYLQFCSTGERLSAASLSGEMKQNIVRIP